MGNYNYYWSQLLTTFDMQQNVLPNLKYVRILHCYGASVSWSRACSATGNLQMQSGTDLRIGQIGYGLGPMGGPRNYFLWRLNIH